MKTLIAVVLLALGVVAGLAQPPYVIWDRIYGGMGDDIGYDIQAVSTGGCIVVGTSGMVSGVGNVYIMRIDNWGDTLWTRTIEGAGNSLGNSVLETYDHGFIICGSTTTDAYIIKTDMNGFTLWTRGYAGSLNSVVETADSGFAFTGVHSGGVSLTRTNSAGITQWSRRYGQGEGYGVGQTPDGGFFVAGITGSSEYPDVYVVKTNNTGDSLWTWTYGGELEDAAYDLKSTSDGGCIIAGYSNVYNPPVSYGREILLIRMNALGDSLWMRTYSRDPGVVGFDYWGRSVVLTQDGGYLVVGDGSFWIDQWAAFGAVVKTDSLGNREWFDHLGGGGWMGGGGLYGVTEIGDGDYIAVGTRCVNGDSTGCNVEVIRLNEYTGVPEIRSPEPQSFKLYPAYPNPFNSTTAISFEVPTTGRVRLAVYNLLGQEVSVLQEQVVGAGRHEVIWDAGDMPSGVYFVQMQAGNFNKVKKVVLLK